MRTINTLTTSAVALLGLVFFGTANLAQAGHPVGNGREMGHGPVVNTSGRIGKEMGHGPVVDPRGKDGKWNKEWHKDWPLRYGYAPYCFPVETCEQPVCQVPVATETPCDAPICETPVVAALPCCEPACGYETYRSFEYHKPCYDGCYPRHHERHQDGSKPTTASSHRNTENLGNMAHRTSGGNGRR